MKGLAHAVLYGLEEKDEPVLIILGDTIIDMDLNIFHDSGDNIIAVVEVDDPSRFGIVETDKDNMITGMVEKPENPKSNLAIAGAYFLQSQRKLKAAIEAILEKNIKTRGEYQLTDALKMMMDEGEKFKAVPIKAWYDCGTPETLLSTNRYLLQRHAEQAGECRNCNIHEPVYIGKGAVIEDSEIGPDAAIGKNVRIRNSRIRNSLVFEGAELEDVDLHDSLIGEKMRLKGKHGSFNIAEDE
jgi:glucose-1-phosphate thymidylyltransferase